MPLKTIGKLGFGSTHAQCEMLWSEGFWGHPVCCHQSPGILPCPADLLLSAARGLWYKAAGEECSPGHWWARPLLKRHRPGDTTAARRTSRNGNKLEKPCSHSLQTSPGLCHKPKTSLWTCHELWMYPLSRWGLDVGQEGTVAAAFC